MQDGPLTSRAACVWPVSFLLLRWRLSRKQENVDHGCGHRQENYSRNQDLYEDEDVLAVCKLLFVLHF